MQRTQTCLLILLLAATTLGCGSGGGDGIITIGPNITETVFALGAGKSVIARDTFSDHPRECYTLPSVGGYIDPDLEQITQLAPGMIIAAGAYPKVAEFATSRGIPIHHISMDSLETIDQGIAQLGGILGKERAARRLRNSMQAQWDEIRGAVAAFPRPKVLIITGRESHDLNTLNTVGGASFLSEIVDIAGAENIYAQESQAYLEASKETIVMQGPEVIIEFHCGKSLTEKQTDAYYNDWKSLAGLPAVERGAIHIIKVSHGMRPGPRLPEIARMLALLFHPEADLDL